MTSFDYAKSRAVAEKLIAKFGQTGAIRRDAKYGSDRNPTITTTDYPCKLVDLDYDETKIDGTLIKRGDRMVYMSTEGLSIVPSTSDKAVIASVAHAIVSVKPLSPGGTVVMWAVQARR